MFVVVDVTSDPPVGLGTTGFRVPPQRGDMITRSDSDGIAQAYEVVAVMHPFEPAETCGDLIIRRRGTDLELRRSMHAQ